MMVIGVTGGIASGKSTVARMLSRGHLPHIDADKLVHHLLAYDQPTIAEIEHYFPGVTEEGQVSRRKLGQAIAGDEAKLKTLENILHARVRQAEEQAILRYRRQRRRAVIMDIPLLFETGAEQLCDVVIAVAAPLKMRRRRAMARLHMKPETFDRLVKRQLTDAERCARADIVIRSTLGLAFTRRRIDALMKQWKLY